MKQNSYIPVQNVFENLAQLYFYLGPKSAK